MTHGLITPPAQDVPAPPYAEIHRRQRRAVITTTVLASIVGTLLIAGALFLNDLTNTGGTVAPVPASESTVSSESNPTNETALAAVALNDVSDVASQVVDSIVVVEVTIDARGPFDTTGSGSGVILSEDGTIITNAHVVDNATSVNVELTDGTRHVATVVAADTAVDLAILDIDASGLNAIALGSTTGLLVGDPVIAIGNPLALEGGPSMSTGIVSALDRVLEGTDTTLTGIIQTDAAITEGSSGGALLDANGQLIGITTAVGISSVGVEGIAFAIPVETVSQVLDGLGGV